MGNKKQLMIGAGSPVKETAGSIVKTYESGFTHIELRAIGAGSVSQMFKALATARSIFAQKGRNMSCRPGYDETIIDGDKKTVMVAFVDVE